MHSAASLAMQWLVSVIIVGRLCLALPEKGASAELDAAPPLESLRVLPDSSTPSILVDRLTMEVGQRPLLTAEGNRGRRLEGR
jgi:hypothetical protein